MDNPNNIYRKAMRHLSSRLHPDCEPIVCVRCAGWSSFGGKDTPDVSMGPICICDRHWQKLSYVVRKISAQHAPTSNLSRS